MYACMHELYILYKHTHTYKAEFNFWYSARLIMITVQVFHLTGKIFVQ